MSTSRHDGDPESAETNGDPNGGGHPDSGGGRQSLDVPRLLEFQNGAGANEADARGHALHDLGE